MSFNNNDIDRIMNAYDRWYMTEPECEDEDEEDVSPEDDFWEDFFQPDYEEIFFERRG